jgi:hypothetical protein
LAHTISTVKLDAGRVAPDPTKGFPEPTAEQAARLQKLETVLDTTPVFEDEALKAAQEDYGVQQAVPQPPADGEL